MKKIELMEWWTLRGTRNLHQSNCVELILKYEWNKMNKAKSYDKITPPHPFSFVNY